jgi:hypothetical protein
VNTRCRKRLRGRANIRSSSTTSLISNIKFILPITKSNSCLSQSQLEEVNSIKREKRGR